MPTPPYHRTPIDQKTLRAYRLGRVRAELKRHDYAGILLYDPINVRYATGSANMQVWTLHNKARYAFVPTQGPVVLFDFHNCEFLSKGIETIDEVRPATSYFYFMGGPRADEFASRWAAEIAELVRLHGGGNRRLAVDKIDPPGLQALVSLGVQIMEGEEVMETARAIKNAVEIEAMREAVVGCEESMRRMQAALKPGITENALWSVLHQTNIELGGEWIETRLLTSGPRTNPWFQECSERVIEAGDMVSFDTDLIGPNGYCSDLSRSWICGERKPTNEQRTLYALAREQIEHNIALAAPGIGFREYAEKAFRLPEDCLPNRYSVLFHGVGLCDEYPAVVFKEDFERGGYDGVLVPGMTICVEALVGRQGGREMVKLEEQVLVTATGVEKLSSYPFEEGLS